MFQAHRQQICIRMRTIDDPNVKREQFRLQIRRRHVEQIVADRRKQFAKEEYFVPMSQMEPANSAIIKKCLIKNQLVPQLPTLLPGLARKLQGSPSLANIQFVLTVSSNILLDDISLSQREYIYGFCSRILRRSPAVKISPLVEAYFYQVVMATCYACLDESEQIQIEGWVMARIFEMLRYGDLDYGRTVGRDCQWELLEELLGALHEFYAPDLDHNNTLLYKVKRTVDYVERYVYWMEANLRDISECPRSLALNQLMASTVNSISGIPYSLASLLPKECAGVLFWTLLNQLQLGWQALQPIKAITASTLLIMHGEQQQQVCEMVNEEVIKLVVQELERSINPEYRIELIRLLSAVASWHKRKQLQTSVQNLLQQAGGLVTRILAEEQHKTEHKLLITCLIFIRDLALMGFEQGDSQYVGRMGDMGVKCMLDSMYIAIKDKELLELIDEIYFYFDIC